METWYWVLSDAESPPDGETVDALLALFGDGARFLLSVNEAPDAGLADLVASLDISLGATLIGSTAASGGYSIVTDGAGAESVSRLWTGTGAVRAIVTECPLMSRIRMKMRAACKAMEDALSLEAVELTIGRHPVFYESMDESEVTLVAHSVATFAFCWSGHWAQDQVAHQVIARMEPVVEVVEVTRELTGMVETHFATF